MHQDSGTIWLSLEDIALGFEQFFRYNVNLEHERFIDDFGQKVLPDFLKPTYVSA